MSVAEELESSSPHLKVLIIDDSKTIRRTAESILSRQGFDVITAVDGYEALSRIAEHEPDIIFVDILMPRLDGYQTCTLIKHNQRFRDTPVIMLSSKDGIFDRAKGRVVGSDHYITKPFNQEDLLGAIRDHVQRHGRAAEWRELDKWSPLEQELGEEMVADAVAMDPLPDSIKGE